MGFKYMFAFCNSQKDNSLSCKSGDRCRKTEYSKGLLTQYDFRLCEAKSQSHDPNRYSIGQKALLRTRKRGQSSKYQIRNNSQALLL